MKTLLILTKRNSKLFFKDKGMFFSSLITPAILLVLYVTFLSNVYRDSFLSALPEGFALSDSIIDGVVGGQLASSLLAVCCVTIAFCSNLLMIQDKVTGSVRDLTVTPVRRSVLAMGYFASSALVTLIVCLVTCGICFAYLAAIGGWFLSGGDIALILLDVFLLTLFGTALSSCLHYFLTTQGQLSAVGTLVSAALYAAHICPCQTSPLLFRRRCRSSPALTARACCITTGCAARSTKWAAAACPRRSSMRYATALTATFIFPARPYQNL